MRLKYKELCELLGEEPKKQTNSKKYQLKRFRQVADIEKIPHKNLYEVSLKSNIQPFKDVLLSSPKDCLTKSLYGLFAQINDYKIMTSLPELLRNLGVTNKKFYLSKYNSKKIKEVCFISECEKMFNRLIKDTLRQMKQNDDIYYIKHYSLAIKIFNNKLKKMICNTRLMTDEEVSRMLNLRKQVAHDKYNKSYSHCNNLQKNYIDNIICKEMNIDFYFFTYEIILNHKGIISEYNKKEIIQTKKDLNEILILKIKKSKQGFLKQLDTKQKEKLIKKLLTK